MREHLLLERRIVGDAQRTPKRKIAEQTTRRCGIVKLLADGSDRNGGDAGSFEDVG
jgi:hypothetical protein